MSHPLPAMSLRFLHVWRRNFLVWRKLLGPAMLGNFIEPLLYLFALGFGLGAFVGEMQGMPYSVFLASGLVCASAMNTATFEALFSAYTRMAHQQTWGGMLATPLIVDDIVLGEMIWAGTKSLLSVAPIVAVAAGLGLVHDLRALWVLPLVLLAGTSFAALALCVTAFAKSYDFFVYYFTLVITPMFLLSGTFFPLEAMPKAVRWGAQVLPLTHAVELVRPLMTGQALTHPLLHLGVLILYGAAGLYVACILLRRRLMA
ncbi:MAG: ABC transporter permease [Gammaproteobacteria bacterium]|nr:ABC transporter permease [Gammaproteobacteria bacterium]